MDERAVANRPTGGWDGPIVTVRWIPLAMCPGVAVVLAEGDGTKKGGFAVGEAPNIRSIRRRSRETRGSLVELIASSAARWKGESSHIAR